MKTLKARLIENIENSYYVMGDDLYLFDKAKSLIFDALSLQMPDFNLTVFDNENWSVKSFLASCEVFPMIDEKRLIVVKNISKILESEKKQLVEYFENPVKSTVVVILDFDKVFDFISPLCAVVDAKRMEKFLVSKILVANLSKEGKKISSEAVDLLFESCNGYLTKIQLELEKLVAYCEEELITKDMVEDLVIKEVEYNVFALIDSLSKKEGDRCLQILSTLEKEKGVFALICNHFKRLFFISITEGTNKDLASMLGVKEYAVVKARGFLKGFSKIQLKKINSLLEECDFSIKNGAMNDKNTLYFLVFNILNI